MEDPKFEWHHLFFDIYKLSRLLKELEAFFNRQGDRSTQTNPDRNSYYYLKHVFKK